MVGAGSGAAGRAGRRGRRQAGSAEAGGRYGGSSWPLGGLRQLLSREPRGAAK